MEPRADAGRLSGGAGASVAAGMTPMAVGTDGGGSVRIPASYCGLVGVKPTFGLVPKEPGFPGWKTLSIIGPLTRTVRDAAALLEVMAGVDPGDDMSYPGGDRDSSLPRPPVRRAGGTAISQVSGWPIRPMAASPRSIPTSVARSPPPSAVRRRHGCNAGAGVPGDARSDRAVGADIGRRRDSRPRGRFLPSTRPDDAGNGGHDPRRRHPGGHVHRGDARARPVQRGMV